MENSHQKTIKIGCVLLGHFEPEEISLEVDNEKIIVHGQHQCEQEDGFHKSEFMRVFRLPAGIDPTTVTPHIGEDGSVLVIESKKHVEDKANDGKFEAKLDLRGFKQEEIKLQRRGNMLTVTGIGMQVSERQQSRKKFSRCIKLPDDVDPSSVTSSLSKEGVLTIKASRDPARLSRKSSDDIPITRETSQETKKREGD